MLSAATTTTMAGIGYTLRFEPVPARTHMRWSGQVQANGAFRLPAWLGWGTSACAAGTNASSDAPAGAPA
jgi:hypothetical protein